MSADLYKDRVAIVTGGCQGIGKACADIFFKNGGKVAVWDIHDEIGETLKDVSGGGEMLYIHCDMTKETDIRTAVDQTIETFGRIDCLVNNAGLRPPTKTIDEFSGDDLRKLLELNIVGYFLASKFTLPHIRKTKGNIVNIASISGSLCGKESVTYCCTKGGVSAMSRALAIDEAPNGVRVNAISPGPTSTPLLVEFVKSWSEEQRAKVNDLTLMRRLGEPEEMAKLCFFLATDATYMTGEDTSEFSEYGPWTCKLCNKPGHKQSDCYEHDSESSSDSETECSDESTDSTVQTTSTPAPGKLMNARTVSGKSTTQPATNRLKCPVRENSVKARDSDGKSTAIPDTPILPNKNQLIPL